MNTGVEPKQRGLWIRKVHGSLPFLYLLLGLHELAVLFYHFELVSYYRHLGCIRIVLTLASALFLPLAVADVLFRLVHALLGKGGLGRLLFTVLGCLVLWAPYWIRSAEDALMCRVHFERHRNRYVRIATGQDEGPGIHRSGGEVFIALPDTRILITGPNFHLVYSPDGRAEERFRKTGRYFDKGWEFEARIEDGWYVVAH